MNNHSDEIRISIKHLIQAVLLGWKAILVTALVLAVLGGGFRGITAGLDARDPDVRAADEAAYQSDLAAYESRKTELEMEIAIQEQGITRNQAYLLESALMNIDPYNLYEGTLCLYISAETENSDKTDAAVLLYQAALIGDQVVDDVASELGMEGRYLREILSVTVGTTGTTTTVTSSAPIVNIIVKCQSREQAEQILDLMEAELDEVYDLVYASIGVHTVNSAVRSIRVVADQTLMDTQKNALNRVENLKTSLTQAQAELAALSAPSVPTYTAGAIVKSAVKYAILFGVVGAVLAVAVICVKFISGDRVYSGRELEYRCGLRILGNVCTCDHQKLRGLDKTLWRMEGRALPGDEGALKLATAKIRGFAPEANTILLAGQADARAAAALADKLDDPRFRACGSLLTDPQAMELLRTCDAVVLVEQCGLARYSKVNRETELIRELNADLVGCLVIDG